MSIISRVRSYAAAMLGMPAHDSKTTCAEDDGRTSLWRNMPPILPLQSEHVANAKLFANRAEAVKSLPRGGSIAEIGVAYGDFSQHLLDSLQPTFFDAFDVFSLHKVEIIWGRPSHEVFRGRTHLQYYESRFHDAIEAGVLHVFPGDSSTVLQQARPDEFYDMIYIDGDHTYEGVLKDAEVASKKLKPDGFLIFNDYIMCDHVDCTPYGIIPVVNDYCVNGGWEVVYFALQQGMFCDICIRRRVS